MSTISVLTIPIKVDALFLNETMAVLGPNANFSQLPWFDGMRDRNPETPFLSEGIESGPFSNANLHLPPGVHLHWSLPDALTRGAHDAESTKFPLVPNRWLISRFQQGSVTAQWVVESDYLHHEDAAPGLGVTCIPYATQQSDSTAQPFRYLGRSTKLENWEEEITDRFYPLTAVGYGDPTFAAFYPNCLSVFGFQDTQPGLVAGPDLEYQVLGWYSDLNQDPVKEALSDHPGPLSPTEFRELMREAFSWDPGENFSSVPGGAICFGRIQFENPATAPTLPEPKISMGFTGSEALAALLSEQLHPSSPSKMEDLLEAILYQDKLETIPYDLPAKLKEERHSATFTGASGGSRWTIRPQEGENSKTEALPAGLVHKIHELNQIQRKYDQQTEQIEQQKSQVFSDWYKYLASKYPPPGPLNDYPDPELIRYFIEERDLEPLRDMILETGRLRLSQNEAGITGADSEDSIPASTAFLLAQKINALVDELETLNLNPETPGWALQTQGASRFWEANEPVVLLSGPLVEPTDRHAQDGAEHPEGMLECGIWENWDLANLNSQTLNPLTTFLGQQRATLPQGFRTWNFNPWHPFQMDWSVEVYPLKKRTDGNEESINFDPELIQTNFRLQENSPELSPSNSYSGNIQEGKVNTYTGTSILTPQAKLHLQDRIANFLKPQLTTRFRTQTGNEEENDPTGGLDLDFLIDWYKNVYGVADPNVPEAGLILVLEQLESPDFHSLSQSLGGFNEALLQLTSTFELMIRDPLGFPEERNFADQDLSQIVGQALHTAPLPKNDFQPIRSGNLRLEALRLIDTFGQFRDLDVREVARPERAGDPMHDDRLLLTPRITQPARLHFHWLAAFDGDMETNDHPLSNPVCGWLLPNNLDQNLEVFDADGKAMGLINRNASWETAPGGGGVESPSGLSHPRLQKVVNYILQRGAGFLSDLLTAFNDALDGVFPLNSNDKRSRALLMGRPLAVVRAGLNLELQGRPSVNQDWSFFRHDLQRTDRQNMDFPKVKFPVRIGEYKQLNDTLIAFWTESDGAISGSPVFVPQTENASHPDIKSHSAHPLNLQLSLAEASSQITLLIDPHGPVHATTGILPVKKLELPAEYYVPALEKLQATFRASPVITPPDHVQLPLPEEQGLAWSWVEKRGNGWKEYSATGMVSKSQFNAAFPDEPDLWDELLSLNWLEASGESLARIPNAENRNSSEFGTGFQTTPLQVEAFFDSLGLGFVNTRASFGSKQVIREGWLKLSKKDISNS